MGGAGAWHIGLHYPSEWAAVEAGAGFTETRRYARRDNAPEHEQRAWRIYDAVDYAANAFNVPMVGYGGEIDPQLQASRNIAEKLREEGLTDLRVLFLVGPQTPHRWHPDSRASSEQFIRSVLPRRTPDRIRFVTYTTRYNRIHRITIEGLDHHYERAEVDARTEPAGLVVRTRNVSALRLPPGPATIDGQSVAAGASFARVDGKWVAARASSGLRKRHGLQGPIDDAFLDSFLCVRPQKPHAAFDRFSKEFTKWMRGDVRVQDERAVTPADLRDHHIVLFGDPSTSTLLAKVNARLPVRYQGNQIIVGDRKFDASNHSLALIYPNPLNPDKYLVLNTGHTFHEAEFKGTNALLYPRLGDYAVLDASGQVVLAGYFDESWRLTR
ncbi:MAG: hypothetical protein ACRD44_15175 [Bryobacteraceae bacterium]